MPVQGCTLPFTLPLHILQDFVLTRYFLDSLEQNWSLGTAIDSSINAHRIVICEAIGTKNFSIHVQSRHTLHIPKMPIILLPVFN